MMDLMTVHPATRADCDQIWALLQPVFSAGDTYAVDPLIDRDAAITYWMDAEKTAYHGTIYEHGRKCDIKV